MNENLNLMNSYKYHPTTKEELQKLIEQRIKEEGNEVDLNDIDISNITDMYGLLLGFDKFNGNISKWDVSNVTNMSWMFSGCENFNGDISGWNVSKVIDMDDIFYLCPIEDRYKPKF